MKHYLTAAGAAEVQKQIAAQRAHLLKLRATRDERDAQRQASNAARAAMATMRKPLGCAL